MKKDLSTEKGTIANVLEKHKDELFELIQLNDFEKLKKRVNELLDDSSLKNNSAKEEAKQILNKAAVRPNYYYSVLMTYLTGMKVSI